MDVFMDVSSKSLSLNGLQVVEGEGGSQQVI